MNLLAMFKWPAVAAFCLLMACSGKREDVQGAADPAVDSAHVSAESGDTRVVPRVVTEASTYDTDDPAIWVNPEDASKSLILGTDKDADGSLLVYNLQGEIQADLSIKNLQRPNNVDVEYGLPLGGKSVDIAVLTERLTNSIRIYSVPDMQPIDGGGIEVFAGEMQQAPMGIALYKRESDDAIFVIVSRKEGPSGTYLWQYQLMDDGTGQVMATKVREFGGFSGKNEIEALVVDDQMGYLYYSDEGHGIRKYYADPLLGDEELAVFGTEGFTEDHEGLSIYTVADYRGYIIASDQQANTFRIFPREGTPENPHDHKLLKVVKASTNESDGSEASSVNFGPAFPYGLFVAMSDDRTFQIYAWEDIAGKDLSMRETP